MERVEEKVTLVSYRSSVRPEIETRQFREDEESSIASIAKLIAWADENPVAWDIVIGTKSKAHGRTSSRYLGSGRGTESCDVIYRLQQFEYELNGPIREHEAVRESIFRRSARFTMERYRDKGFTGGMFQQFDGRYDRGALVLDYTPETRDEVIDRFLAWCGRDFETHAVKIDGKVVRDLTKKQKGKKS